MVRFNSSGQLWGEVNIFLLWRVVDVHQDSTLGIRQVQRVVYVSAAALLRAVGGIGFLVSRLAAYLQGVFVPRTELNYICNIIEEINTVGP